jgi:hypothetical protein
MMIRAFASLTLLLVLALEQRVVIRNKDDPDNPNAAGASPNLFVTSFRTVEAGGGWNAEHLQKVATCGGLGFYNLGGGQPYQTGIGNGGDNLADGTSASCDAVTTGGNFGGGAGGRGFKHWVNDGFDANSGAFNIDLPSAQTEIWISYYIAWQPGFTWSAGNPQFIKDWYFDQGHNPANAIGYTSNGGFGTTQFFPVSRNISNNYTWQTVYGTTSDGKFHCFEHHLKTDTNGSNGIFETWVDGVAAVSVSDVNYGGASFQFGQMMVNQNNPANGGIAWEKIDDIGVGNLGRIRCPYAVGF